MSKDKDTQLIWENYQTRLNEAEEFSMDKLVYMGEEQFNKMRGKADHDDIIRDIEKTYIEFFTHNMRQYSNADQLVTYIEDGGFKDDLMSQLGLDGERENDVYDAWDDLLTKHEEVEPTAVQQEESPDADNSDLSDINSIFRIDLYNGNSMPIIMNDEVKQDMEGLDGPHVGAVTTWMGEEYMYIKINRS